jgi:hypothetical protein
VSLCPVATSYHSGLVSSVMFDVIYEVCGYRRVPFRYWCSLTLILKRRVLIQLVPFNLLRVLPLGVAILKVKTYGFVVVSGNLVSVLEYGAVTVALQPGLVHHSTKLLRVVYVAFARLPTGGPHEVVLERAYKDTVTGSS